MKKSEVFNEGYQKGLRAVMRILKEQIETPDYSKLSEIYTWIDDLTLASSSKKQAELRNSGEFDDNDSFQDWLSGLGEPYIYGRYEGGLLQDDIVESNGEGETTYDAERDCLYIALNDGGYYRVDEFMRYWISSEVDYNGNRTFFNIDLYELVDDEVLNFKKLEFILK